jgi:hypothetical protein
MKKTFQLNIENKNKDRVLEAVKHEIRKYIKREKRKTLPEDVDFWDFKCKFAKNSDEPVEIKFVDITKNIDEASIENCDSFYMEILSSKGYYKKDIEEPVVENEESEGKDLS